MVGDKVYCNIDLRQHPMCDDKACDRYVPRIHTSNEKVEVIKQNQKGD